MKLKRMIKMYHFKESYLHYMAKYALKYQIENNAYGINPLRVDIEPNFCMNGLVLFRPDLVVYTKNGIDIIFEVIVTNVISTEKKDKMDYYFFHNKINPHVFQIKANTILKRCL